jgi:hypothetical protein
MLSREEAARERAAGQFRWDRAPRRPTEGRERRSGLGLGTTVQIGSASVVGSMPPHQGTIRFRLEAVGPIAQWSLSTAVRSSTVFHLDFNVSSLQTLL